MSDSRRLAGVLLCATRESVTPVACYNDYTYWELWDRGYVPTKDGRGEFPILNGQYFGLDAEVDSSELERIGNQLSAEWNHLITEPVA